MKATSQAGKATPMILLKAAPGPGLSQKQITDKNGVVTKRWVKVGGDQPGQEQKPKQDQQPQQPQQDQQDQQHAQPQPGQHVGFEHGEHKGHGEVTGSGKDGVTVRDSKGGEHRVPHGSVTHHWEGDGAPDASPHDQGDAEVSEEAVKQLEGKAQQLVTSAGMHEFYGSDDGDLPVKARHDFKDWDSLLSAANEAQPKFKEMMEKVGEALGGKAVRFDEHDFSQPGVVYGVGPVKGEKRAKEKVEGKYGGDYGRLCDMVRGSIGFDTADQMREGIAKLKELGLELAAKAENKFSEPTDAGYSDINLNFKMPNGVVGELQLHLNGILAVKGEGHHYYEESRSLQAKLAKGAGTGEGAASYGQEKDDGREADISRIQELLLKQRHLYNTAKVKALSAGGLQKSYLAGKVILLMKGGRNG